jgi:hypothetical protein
MVAFSAQPGQPRTKEKVVDKNARQKLIADIVTQKAAGGEIAVPLDLFFTGNDDRSSIGCNLGDKQPAIQEFHAVLASLRERPEVQDILVRVYDADDDTSWPYTDTVYVISSLPQNAIESALERLRFDQVSAEWMYGKPASAPEPKPGFTPYSIWWD